MNKIEKELLISKLKKNNVLFNEEKLDEVIVAYNKLIDFVLESNKVRVVILFLCYNYLGEIIWMK